MKIKKFTQKIEEAIEKHNINVMASDDYSEYCYYAIRFENKDREIGEVCNNSRHNIDRQDEREFPQYGSEDYDDMMELDGASGWYISEDGSFDRSVYTGEWQTEDDNLLSEGDHCYIIGGDVEGLHPSPDRGEIIICEAVVIEKLF